MRRKARFGSSGPISSENVPRNGCGSARRPTCCHERILEKAPSYRGATEPIDLALERRGRSVGSTPCQAGGAPWKAQLAARVRLGSSGPMSSENVPRNGCGSARRPTCFHELILERASSFRGATRPIDLALERRGQSVGSTPCQAGHAGGEARPAVEARLGSMGPLPSENGRSCENAEVSGARAGSGAGSSDPSDEPHLQREPARDFPQSRRGRIYAIRRTSEGGRTGRASWRPARSNGPHVHREPAGIVRSARSRFRLPERLTPPSSRESSPRTTDRMPQRLPVQSCVYRRNYRADMAQLRRLVVAQRTDDSPQSHMQYTPSCVNSKAKIELNTGFGPART